ncbi:hypothetical protein EHS39_36220 [Ensifer sp. MPMI2T]|nr:hypothetical protein EHS39_36220 [Ensifer sp. MPMI2T]
MTAQNYKSPNGSPIVGTAEKILATANITGINPDGTPNYEGGSDIHWDTQKALVRDGKILFVDEDGDEWTFDQLVLVEEDSEEDD